MAAGDFYGSVYDTAKSLGATDVQAHLAAAQASQETGFGKSVFGNNYFGVKASPSYDGLSGTAATTEEYNGQTVNTTGNFRMYEGLTQSVKDYMDTMAKNFPDAWNAPTVSEAVDNLSEGKYGKYALDSNYETKIGKIASKYGPQVEAQQVETAAPIPQERPVVNSFDALANPGVPTPDLAKNGLLSAMFEAQPTPTSASPFDAVLGTQAPVAAPVDATATGLLGQAPNLSASAVATPTVTDKAAMAAAGPMSMMSSTPMDQAPTGGMNVGTGLLSQPASIFDRMGIPQSDFPSMAAASPMAAPVQATGLLGAMQQPDLSASAAVPGMQAPSLNNFADLAQAGAVQAPGAMGINSPQQQAMDANVAAQLGNLRSLGPTATANNFSDLAAASPMATQVNATPTGLLGQAPNLSASASVPMSVAPADNQTMASRFAPSIDPTTNTQSFIGDPSVAPGIAAATAATQTPTGLLSGYQAPAAPTPAENAIGGLLSAPQTISAVSNPLGNQAMFDQAISPSMPSMMSVPSLDAAPPATDLAVSSPAYQGLVSQSYAPSIPSVEAAQSLPDTSTVQSTVTGPATTSAVDQQQSTNSSFPSAPAKTGLLGGIVNKNSLMGGLLGAAVAGPLGGLLGGVIGNQVNKNGGLTGLLGSPAQPTTNIGGGIANIGGIYNGAFSPGSYAIANNGGLVSALGNGWTSYTNSQGVTNTISPNGTQYADWSGIFGGSGDDHTGVGDNSGQGRGGGSGGYSSPGLF